MKAYQNKTLGQTVTLQVPETAEEFDSLAGATGLCVKDANRNVIYRQWNHEFRKAFCDALENETGIARKTKTVGEGDKAKEVFDETEAEYLNGLELGKHIDEERMSQIAQEVAAEVKFDPTPSTRSKKIPKEITNAAAGLMAAVNAGETDAKKLAKNFEKVLGIESFTVAFGEVSEDSLAAALLADKEKTDRERSAKFL